VKHKTVGVIGLGIMGSAMSSNLVKTGFKTYGYDVAAAARNTLKRAGGVPCTSALAVAKKVEIIITSLPSAAALHAVAAELASGKPGKRTVIETSTLPIEDKHKARETLKRAGITLLDCPLSGTGAQARHKDLSVYVSGEKSAFPRILPTLKGFSREQFHVGEFGNGSKMKFVANLLVAIHNVSSAEAFVLGMKAGLDPAMILKVVASGAGGSRMFQVRGPMMVAGKYDDATMKNEVWQKDMKIIGEFATRLDVATPLFNASGAIYNAAMAQGFGKQDTGAVCAVMERMSNLKRR
jgi:3-hydroxyisobutyrate dehydrogenase-like beta-hydroxyacid dehydrogenase